MMDVEDYSGSDEVLDILGQHNCKKVPTPETIAGIISEIAHKEILQEPMFIIECWKNVLQDSTIATSIEGVALKSLYEESVPTGKRVLDRMEFPAVMSESEKETARNIKRYIREADENTLKCLLRFCTGCDILVQSNKTINIDFLTYMTEFERRPIGRTCSSLLQLPTGHESYPQFRTELNGVLRSGVWVIDYV